MVRDKHPMYTVLKSTIVQPVPLKEIQDIGPMTDEEAEETPWGTFSIHGGAGAGYFDKEVYEKAKSLKIFPIIDGVNSDGTPYYPLALDNVDAYRGKPWKKEDILIAAINKGLIIAKLPDTVTSEYYRWYVCVPPTDLELLAFVSKQPKQKERK